VHSDSLDATIDQLQTAINGDPQFDTFAGQLAVLVGEIAAVDSLSPS
jgi:hypothetical protein